MDMTLNRIPDSVNTIHIIAVCGTAMGALACMLKEMGFRVTGSDQKIYPPMSTFLLQKGVDIMDGFHADHLTPPPDLVIVGNAVSKGNPEVEETQRLGIPFCSLPQALNHFAAKGKKSLVITGTHGKTTTSSLAAWTLFRAGLDPSFMVGGILKNFDNNYRLGRGEHMVLEGDEYDTAFFDKGSKFLHFTPSVAVLTSVEFDHADIFKDLDQIRKTFDRFIDRIPDDSLLLAYDADPEVSALVRQGRCEIQRYGLSKEADWSLDRIRIEAPWTTFDVIHEQRLFGRFRTRLMGEHNLLNALSVIAAAHRLGLPLAAIQDALESFQGVKRRQEIRGIRRDITVMDDFAHHPTAVRETIRAVKPFFPEGRLIAVFEPRTNSSMRSVFQDVYPASFDAADLVCIRRPPLLEKVPEGQRMDAEKMVADIRARGKTVHYFPDTETIIDHVGREARGGDVVLIMSNGGFDNIHERLLERLEASNS